MADRIENYTQDSQRDRSRTPRELYGFPTWARPAQSRWPQPPPPPHFPPVQPRQLFPATQPFIPQSQPYTPPSTPLPSPPPTSSPARAYDLKINNTWTQDTDHYDSTKQNGLELFRTIRASQFSSQMGIEGCDPLALPLSAMLYATTDHQSLRRLSHGRELYIIPTSDIASCIFMTKLNQELKRRGVDLDRASQTYCREQLQQTLDRSTAKKPSRRPSSDGFLLELQTPPHMHALPTSPTNWLQPRRNFNVNKTHRHHNHAHRPFPLLHLRPHLHLLHPSYALFKVNHQSTHHKRLRLNLPLSWYNRPTPTWTISFNNTLSPNSTRRTTNNGPTASPWTRPRKRPSRSTLRRHWSGGANNQIAPTTPWVALPWALEFPHRSFHPIRSPKQLMRLGKTWCAYWSQPSRWPID